MNEQSFFPSASSTPALTASDVLAAAARIKPIIRETPVDYSPLLSQYTGCEVYLKLEHLQYTGSFKLRGATNKILSLSGEQLEQGVVAASTGNHGLGVCYAARQAGTTATVYLPRDVAPGKLRLMQRLGGQTVPDSADCLAAEITARAAAEDSGQVFVSPYNDLDVIAGQGTIGVELAHQLEHIDAVFVSVGGGGLIAGIGAYLKEISPRTRIVGCWPEHSPVMYECLRAGKIFNVPELPTISESTAGGLEDGSVTFPLCQNLIDDYVLVSEEEIQSALRLLIEQERWLVEGAAGVALAALLKEQTRFAGQTVVVLLCGRNIASAKLAALF